MTVCGNSIGSLVATCKDVSDYEIDPSMAGTLFCEDLAIKNIYMYLVMHDSKFCIQCHHIYHGRNVMANEKLFLIGYLDTLLSSKGSIQILTYLI